MSIDKAVEVRRKILDRMVGISLKKHLLRRKDQTVLIEPSLLIQCLFTVSKRLYRDKECSLKYELCSYHELLFNDSGML